MSSGLIYVLLVFPIVVHTLNPSESELECMDSHKKHRWMPIIAMSVILVLSVILFLLAFLIKIQSQKLEREMVKTEHVLFAVGMDDVLRRLYPNPLVSEMLWRAGCVQLRQNAKHERHYNRALAHRASETPKK
ncbi:hypothetical protein M3Y98_00452500 [Aphelenchoides besseyi]|nr:hypothetical protein M3Y98_00452500 [Aphelenchoides besseyi]KAI6207407.1 hypothetical protein M3Y96_00005800 [Aphelenchoides besseyi]